MCSTGGGSAQLLRLKIEDVFKNAIVITTLQKNIKDFDSQLPDLFLTTIPMENEYAGIPVIHIKHLLDESEIR